MGAFEALISRATAVEQAQSEGKTLFQLFSDHKVTGQYRELAAASVSANTRCAYESVLRSVRQ